MDFIKTELPLFFEKFFTPGMFSNDEWKKALSETIVTLENSVSDGPHILSSMIFSLILPAIAKGLVKVSEIVWMNDDSFDVWP